MRFDKWEDSLGQPRNSVIQVFSKVLTSTSVISSTSTFTTASAGGESLSIGMTPKFSNSLIKLEWTIQGVADGGNLVAWCAPYKDSNSLYTNTGDGKLGGYHYGDAWKITYGSSSDNNVINTFTGFYYDTAGSLSNRTYSIRIKNRLNSFYINRSQSDNINQDYSSRGISSFSVTEIAQ
jgi:hypothetical protein